MRMVPRITPQRLTDVERCFKSLLAMRTFWDGNVFPLSGVRRHGRCFQRNGKPLNILFLRSLTTPYYLGVRWRHFRIPSRRCTEYSSKECLECPLVQTIAPCNRLTPWALSSAIFRKEPLQAFGTPLMLALGFANTSK